MKQRTQIFSCFDSSSSSLTVGLGLGELHLVHTLAGVPVKEGLATEHDSELLGDTLPGLLDGGGVTNKGRGHL